MDTLHSRISLIIDNSELSSDAKIEQIKTVLAEKLSIPGIVERLVATPKAEGGYDWINPCITDGNFPTVADPSLEGAQLEAYGTDVSSEFVLADLKAKGRRAGSGAETLHYGLKNPKEYPKHWIVGLGQAASIPRLGACVVVLYEDDDGERRASICHVAGDWGHASSVFLSFPL